ncbi:AAA+-type ATPase, SpoVK/Ycf46/Vps4 family [Halogranum amylolyticum]|uniref:AAA+-type ATPase, SpoVK/Ycf46/Vps4 family n=1 Tax=Halogranum amylolyticum TaxID=660520 RepID=A0A1H8WGG0_9EURY|nr:AAA family ATPase [Halogranum amylolyticum]SEP26517.1 AAA+-type ATPase, SpoVK/Ycf46/Vps4 family [Halogranum amylolyticum]
MRESKPWADDVDLADRATGPYPDSLAHLLDRLRYLDALIRCRLDAWWSETGTVDEYRGLYVSDETVARLVDEGRPTGASPTQAGETLRAAADRRAHEIATREVETRTAGGELRLLRVKELFGLDATSVDALLVALAPSVSSDYETLYSYLQDDVTRKRPTVDLTVELLSAVDAGTRERLAVRRAFARSAPLVRDALVSLPGEREGVPLPSRPVVVAERLVDYLLGGDDIDPLLADVASLEHEVDAGATRLRWLDERARRRVEWVCAADVPATVSLHGPPGAGVRAVATAISHAQGVALLTVDATRVVTHLTDTDSGLSRVLDAVRREALLSDASVLITDVDACSETARRAVVDRLDDLPRTVLLAGSEAWRPPRPPENHAFVAVELGIPPYQTRRDVWRELLDGRASAVDVDGLASTFRFTPGRIADAIATAESVAVEFAAEDDDDDGDGEDDEDGANGETGVLSDATLYHACRELSGQRLETLSTPVVSTFGWDDIVLPAATKAVLRELAARIGHRGRVYTEWGFAEKYTLGNGLLALFTGPSGTGKTMAAEILATDAGVDLYKIDLSRVVSKYIGETEKNLAAVFDEAETTDAILLFDEADALFGTRTEVRDSHDRYANIEVDYLLQRIEAHDGTVILTTNLERNVDDAFLRRIHVSLEFPRPDRTLRRELWERVFPTATPVGDLDYEFLSTFEIPGGNIRNAALTAAFLAAEEGERVEMSHVVRAMRREFQKTGRLVGPDAFGTYFEESKG